MCPILSSANTNIALRRVWLYLLSCMWYFWRVDKQEPLVPNHHLALKSLVSKQISWILCPLWAASSFSFCVTLLYIASVWEGVQYLSANNNLITAELLVGNPDRVMEQSALPELRLRLYVNFLRAIALEDPSLMVSHRRSKSPLAQRQWSTCFRMMLRLGHHGRNDTGFFHSRPSRLERRWWPPTFC